MTGVPERVASVAAALAVVLAAAAALLVNALQSDASADQVRVAAAAAAKQGVETVLSYDYRRIDADVTRAKAVATGVFAQQYADSAAELVDQARQTRAIVQATAGDPAVVAAVDDDVVVLLFVDQASVKRLGRGAPTTRIDQSRVRVTMTAVDGEWRISQLAAL